jgi:hypothetical protein
LKFRLTLLNLTLAATLLAACGGPSQTVTPPAPTAMPSLSTVFWVDYPLVRAGGPQSANLLVSDQSGKPVTGATAVLDLSSGSYQRRYYFKLTDASGRARVAIDVPAATQEQTFVAQVTVIDSVTNHWAQVQTHFNIIKDSK